MTATATPLPATSLPPEIRKQFPFESRFVRVNGHRMHYVDEGAGEPILLLHGNPTWSFLYRKFIPRLVAAGYRAIGRITLASACPTSRHANTTSVSKTISPISRSSFASLV